MYMPTHAGWFDDPSDATQLRYFDGVIWTSHTAPRVTRPTGVDPAQAQQGQQVAPPTVPQQQWAAPAYPGMYRGPATPDGQPLASFGQRVGAFLLDWIIQTVIAAILGSYFLIHAFTSYFDTLTTTMNQAQAGQQPDFAALLNSIDRTQLMFYSIVLIVVFVVYQTAFLSRSGQTPGKMAVGISVRLRERPGPMPLDVVLRRVGLPAALFVVQLIPVIGIPAQIARILDLLWPAWDGNRQALHDKVAATNVVVGKQLRR
ncbi:RDD family protein [Nostocoides sp. HKS02]|uniref:RDD family protein n=1 Tax=Nostocoides sp. HKS02 TaxID=1813880 RepID=UPI0012B4A4EA|nr:RDD family protein [Tetrasphaera sp. HKS02]QGN59305.1 DUF2510 domain-containing protein [Tetrasphaera sp. HKS02]